MSVCLSSVVCITFVRPIQAIEISGNVSTPFGTLATHWHLSNFYGDCPRETPPSGELNIRAGVAEYIDLGPIERYNSEKRCKIGAKLVLITNRKSHYELSIGIKLGDLG